MSRAERRADHQRNSFIIGLGALPVMGAFVGALVAWETSRILSGALLITAAVGCIALYRFAGYLGRKTAQKHKRNR